MHREKQKEFCMRCNSRERCLLICLQQNSYCVLRVICDKSSLNKLFLSLRLCASAVNTKSLSLQ